MILISRREVIRGDRKMYRRNPRDWENRFPLSYFRCDGNCAVQLLFFSQIATPNRTVKLREKTVVQWK